MVPDMKELFAPLLAAGIARAEQVYGGGNSMVFRVSDDSGGVWCGKAYAAPGQGQQDRLDAEWNAFSFLHGHQVISVPKPLARDTGRKVAIYQWCEGRPFSGRLISAGDVELAVEFLGELDELRNVPEAAAIAPAAEACFSLSSLENNLDSRIQRLLSCRAESPVFDEMHGFVRGELAAALVKYMQAAREGYGALGRAVDAGLPAEERILSPSDFGFHNAIDTPAGVVWVDFEYFGWDDAAKTMADFVLHPAMNLSPEAGRTYWSQMLQRFDRAGDLGRRAQYLYPLYGIKWCLIFLNEFLRGGMDRRSRATGGLADVDEARVRQLAKAVKLLETINDHYENFPYH